MPIQIRIEPQEREIQELSSTREWQTKELLLIKINREKKVKYQLGRVAADSKRGWSLLSASHWISLSSLNLSSNLTNTVSGTTIPHLPARWSNIMVAAMSGPWSFPVSNTRSGMKRDFPCHLTWCNCKRHLQILPSLSVHPIRARE